MIGSYDAEKVSELLDIPAEWKPRLVLALGKPDETVVVEDAEDSLTYYRDENDVHHVPKLKTKDLLL
jgi:hypothetical protein